MAIEGIRYPSDLQVDADTDYFKVQVLSYTRKGLIDGADTTGKVSGVSNILLPMPSNIQDANTVSWGEEKMNAITAGAINVLDKTQTLNFNDPIPAQLADIGKAIYGALDKAGLDPQTASNLFRSQLSAEAVNIFGANVSIDQILARQNGQIFNPNLELLFNGVTLRDFRFSFKMTPRDEKERDNVVKIIRTFKKYMAASTGGESGNKLYLQTPNVFKLAYKKGSQDHPFLHRFKDCALKGVSVNYTGENVYATYYDGTPISVILDLNFQELTPIYNEDYDSPETAASNLGVGY